MKSLLQHRAPFLVVFAMMATIGLSSCADTVTGTNEASTQVNTTQGVQTVPAQGERVVEGGISQEPLIHANPLHAADSAKVEVDDEGRTRYGLKIIDRF